MTFEQAVLASKLGVKVRNVIWGEKEYVTHINIITGVMGNTAKAIDENGRSVFVSTLSGKYAEWELYHDSK